MIKNNSIYWGFIDENGQIKIKPFYNFDVIDDTFINPTIKKTISPFKAKDINDATKIINKKIKI